MQMRFNTLNTSTEVVRAASHQAPRQQEMSLNGYDSTSLMKLQSCGLRAKSCNDEVTEPKQQPPRDPLLQLVSLQKASGCWLLDPALAAAVGKTSEEVENTKPPAVNQEVWATILALIWLHGFKIDAKLEWELLAMKAVSWLRAQNVPSECVEAGNTLLGCNVQKDAMGL
ncbi:von Willebrand factor A domain-containing protein 5A isoform X1 [Hippoglossus stenolepis]|uniref:von Willebrand factor A domain-containing protein 5A isoform X1 n=2 Tax=Hippoglossus stenolepis TaxID=195615 RepID=UPI001FAF8C53|nr:von Willebrand factor A domain-containing protein 5A isoform X1 [Hippoglossus stenolepis]